MTDHYIVTRVTTVKKNFNTKSRMWKNFTLSHCWWKCRMDTFVVAKLNCVNLIGLGEAQGISKALLGIWLGHGGVSLSTTVFVVPDPSSQAPFPALLPGCHGLSIFAPPHPSFLMLLPWGQITVD